MKNCLEWDQITAMATAAYNYFPNMSAKESAFFLMYGRDLVKSSARSSMLPEGTCAMIQDSLT